MGVSRPLPYQPTREAEELRQGLEFDRRRARRQATRGTVYGVGKPADATAATGSNFYLMVAPEDVEILAVSYIPATTVVANGSNYATWALGVYNLRNQTSFAHKFDSSAKNLYAGRARAFELTGGSIKLAQGESLRLDITKTGTGVALPDATVQVVYAPRAL